MVCDEGRESVGVEVGVDRHVPDVTCFLVRANSLLYKRGFGCGGCGDVSAVVFPPLGSTNLMMKTTLDAFMYRVILGTPCCPWCAIEKVEHRFR